MNSYKLVHLSSVENLQTTVEENPAPLILLFADYARVINLCIIIIHVILLLLLVILFNTIKTNVAFIRFKYCKIHDINPSLVTRPLSYFAFELLHIICAIKIHDLLTYLRCFLWHWHLHWRQHQQHFM